MKRAKKFFNKVSIFVFSIACVAICIFVAQFFASVLTLGSLQVTSGSVNSFSEFKVYAISFGKNTSKSVAESNALTFRQRNAGGYVYKIDGMYYILGSAYEKENDAKLVQSNLSEESIHSEIIPITFGKVQIAKVSSVNQEKEFASSLNIFKTVFLGLYDISVSLDTNTIDSSKAKIEIIALKAKVEEALEGIKMGTTAIDGIYYQIIKDKYNLVINTLNNLKNYEGEGGIILSAKIKYTYLYSLDIAGELINALNNEK